MCSTMSPTLNLQVELIFCLIVQYWSENGLFVEDKESPAVNLIVARDNNKDDEKVKQFVQSYQTDEVYKKGLELFKGGLVKGW